MHATAKARPSPAEITAIWDQAALLARHLGRAHRNAEAGRGAIAAEHLVLARRVAAEVADRLAEVAE